MKKFLLAIGVVLIIGLVWYHTKKTDPVEAPIPIEPPIEFVEPEPEPEPPVIIKTKPKPKLKPKRKPKPSPPKPVVEPPKVKIYEELIPKDIKIIRVYYQQEFAGPGEVINFAINGSGFNKEFEKMIEVKSGHPKVAVINMKLRTANQIEGQLVVSPQTPTQAIFPQVLIQDKVVFQAPHPFAVIRPREVLNLIFTEMGESGRSGKFRVFTNLKDDEVKNFKVVSSTDLIEVTPSQLNLPFILDGLIEIGPVPTGEYDLTCLLDEQKVWERKGIIRVVKPNMGEAGLVQRVLPNDGYHRPGDKAKFIVQGSGFRRSDTGVLKADVIGMEKAVSSFTYVAPGRLNLQLSIPLQAKPSFYSLAIVQGERVILNVPNSFKVVDKNWTRRVYVNPKLTPGGTATLVLEGRSLSKKFINQISIDLDDPNLTIGHFKQENDRRATASISAKPAIKPGDYWLKMKTPEGPVKPEFGSIIKVDPK